MEKELKIICDIGIMYGGLSRGFSTSRVPFKNACGGCSGTCRGICRSIVGSHREN